MEICDYAFRDSGLENIVIPNSVKKLGDSAFKSCSELTDIVLPNTVETIYLSDCWNLNSFIIPASIKEFSLPSGMSSISVAEGNKVFDSRCDCNAVIETATNKLVYGCQKTIIPDSVTEIGECAFRGCVGLKSLSLEELIEA